MAGWMKPALAAPPPVMSAMVPARSVPPRLGLPGMVLPV
jgi:hypothetical protein